MPLAEGLERRKRVEIFKEVAGKFGFKHDHFKLKYINPYGEFNTLSGVYKAHKIEIKDIHNKPTASYGIITSPPGARASAIKYGSQMTVYAVDGDSKRFPLANENNPRNGYASKEQIEKMIESL